MASTYWGDYGYDYVYAVSAAIASYTARMTRDNPDAFSYFGIPLRYAVERELYFRCINSRRLIRLYDEFRSTGTVGVHRFPDEIEYLLAIEMMGNLNPALGCNIRSGALALPLRLICRARRALEKRRPGADPQVDCKGSLLAYLNHEKFTRLFSGILEHFPGRCAYLSVSRSGFDHGRGDFPLYSLGTGSWDSRGVHPDGELVRFPKLVLLCSALMAAFEKGRPLAVLVPEGNAPDHEVINQVCKRFRIPVLCVQNGWAPYIHNGFRNLSYTKMLIWGEEFASLLRPYNPDQEFAVTGSHLISVKSASAQAGGSAVVFFLQAPDTQLISLQCWDNLLDLICWTAESFPEVPVYVRQHPQHGLSEKERARLARYPNLAQKSPQECSLDELLAASLLSVSVHSSTILESVAAGVLPLIYNETPMPHYYPDVHAAGAGIEVKSLAAAKEVLSTLIGEPQAIDGYRRSMGEFARNYFQHDKKDALNTIVEEITEAIATATSHRS